MKSTDRFHDESLRTIMAGLVLVQGSPPPVESWWLLQPDGAWQFSALVTFSRGAIVVTGDWMVGGPRGSRAVAAIGYGKDWWLSTLGADYLCSKFLQSHFQHELAAEHARAEILERRRARDVAAEEARELWELADRLEDDDTVRHDFGGAWCRVFGDYPCFGDDYDHCGASCLVAIQRRFREAWFEMFPGAAVES